MKLILNIEAKPIFSYINDKTHIQVYGNVYNKDILSKLEDFNEHFKLNDFLHEISGYFLLYIRHNDIEYLANDIFGNFRSYYFIKENTIYFFDAFPELHNNFNDRIKINKFEKKYFQRHRYTSGGSTIYENIKKLLPASILEIRDDSFKEDIYFNSQKVDFPNNQYTHLNYKYIKNNIIENVDQNAHNILMFSGGVDSTYLYLILEELDIDVELCFIKYSIYDMDNIVDLNKVQLIAKHFGKEITILECNVKESYKKYQEKAIKLHLFDKSFFAMYYAMDELKKRYGKCNIINGQSSDSIYCWGNSSKTLGAFLQRLLVSPLFYNSPVLIKKISAKIIEKIYKFRWTNDFKFFIPYYGIEYYIGLLDPQGYVPVVINDEKYIAYLNDITKDILEKLPTSKKDIIYYMKLMYLQGTSNIMVIKAAEQYEHNLLMPFVDARILYLRLMKQNDFKDLFFPRYVLEEVMKEKFSFDLKIIDNAKKVEISETQKNKIEQFNNFVEKIFLEWDDAIENFTK